MIDLPSAILLLLLLLAVAVEVWGFRGGMWRRLWRWLIEGEEQD